MNGAGGMHTSRHFEELTYVDTSLQVSVKKYQTVSHGGRLPNGFSWEKTTKRFLMGEDYQMVSHGGLLYQTVSHGGRLNST